MKYILICLLLLCGFIASAQDRATVGIIGTVYDEAGVVLPGASIFIKDRPGVGTISDANGKFSIRVAVGNTIVITFIGYENMEHMVSGAEKDLKIKFVEESHTIDEVVIVGMGTQRKISVVGAISSVDIAELQSPATSVANMLGGRVAGVISMQQSGEPGKNISEFWIRGIGTFGANSSALVLIDGLEGDLNSVDPADIESFSILKDASATAVYGVRGANGVVLITTKRGQSGKLQITARSNFTISTLNKLPNYLRAHDYALLANEALAVRGDAPLYGKTEMELIRTGLDPDLYPDVYWQDEILNKSSFQQTHYLSARGGGEVAKYFLSLGMSNESSAYKQDKSSIYSTDVAYNTYNYRANLDLNLTKTTSIYFGTDGHLSMKKEPGMANTDYMWYAQSMLTPLTIPTMYSTGHTPAYGPENSYSPYVMLNQTGMGSHEDIKSKVTLAVTQDLSPILEGLKLRVQGAFDNNRNFNETRHILPDMYAATGRSVDGELILSKKVDRQAANYNYWESSFRKYHLEANLNYEKIINDDHRTSALVYYYMSDQKNTADLQSNNTSMNAIPMRYQGISSRLTYGFKDTYLVDVNFGYTGSENFQPGHQFGFFPSAALGWIPSNYKLIKNNTPWLNFLKLRGSYGTVGNDRLSNKRFPYLTIMNENAASGWGNRSGGISEIEVGADNLVWEKAFKADIGIEGRLFDERLTFTVDFFNDKRDGIFQQRTQVPNFVGVVSMPYGNVGAMKSYGSDGNIAYTQKFSQDLSITLRGNYTYSTNEIDTWEQAYPKYPYQVYSGYPSGIIRGLQAIGLFRDEEDVKYSPIQTYGPYMAGDIKYKDINGDGKIDSDDEIPLSNNTYPRLMYGFGLECKYKNMTLGVLFKGTGKTDYYSVGYGGNGAGYMPFVGGLVGNVLTTANEPGNRWTPASYSGDPSTENPNAKFPRLNYGYLENNSKLSTFWKGDSRYLRLQEVSLNYNLRKDILTKIGIRSIDLQLVGTNLYVWSKVKMFDPEQANRNGQAYPIPTRYAFQLYINF
ncbi:SusC/RagA family TonB-linked outer membrane protein [Bacteroidales bacterium]|nr:SusC/RagA family TonB-linked outer membrane protein [Bacteroidales bacterium]